MAELRENAHYIFWSGALAFHGPKKYLYMINTKNSSLKGAFFILCTFVYPRCYGRLKYSKIQRTHGIENIVYFTRVVTNERNFSWR